MIPMMTSIEELISRAVNFLGGLLPFLTDTNIVKILFSVVSLILAVLLCFWGYHLFSCFAAGAGFVLGAGLGFLLSGHFTDKLWIIAASAVVLGLILGFLATRLILLSTFLLAFLLVAIFSCGLLTSFMPSLSNLVIGIIGIILGVIAGLVCVKLQKPVIILVTAFSGALGVIQIFFDLLHFDQITIFYGAFLSLAMIGSIVQFLSNRRTE